MQLHTKETELNIGERPEMGEPQMPVMKQGDNCTSVHSEKWDVLRLGREESSRKEYTQDGARG